MRFTLGSINKLQTPLPVELLSYNIYTTEDNQVGVKWTTATETENDYFTVERSADGRIFKEVKRVDGANTSNESHSYSILDEAPFSGLSYYRLKQTDLDGNYKYLGVRSIELEREDKVVVSPNPLRGFNLNILIHASGDMPLEVRVTTLTGEELYAGRYGADAVQGNRLSLNLPSHIGTGVYIVQVFLNDRVYSNKIFVE